MYILKSLLAVGVFAYLTAAVPYPDDSAVLGDWRGDSICVVRDSACHDEESLYHVSRLPEKPGFVSLKADKIAAGKPVTMGTSDCRYDPTRQSLTCVLPRGTIHLKVDGNKMEGTMTLSDGTLWRKIHLQQSS